MANAEQLGIVTALADPPPRPRLIDRFLVAAYDAGLDPLLLLTKADLARPDELLAAYAPLGVRYLVTGRPLARAEPGRAAGAAGRPDQRSRRPFRRGQVHPGQRPDPGRRPGGRHGQRGDRARPAHLVVGGRAAPAGRRLDHRHAGAAQLRPRAHLGRPGGGGLPRPGRRGRQLPAGLHPPGPDCALDAWVAEHDETGALAARLDSLRRLLRSREGADDLRARGVTRRRPRGRGRRDRGRSRPAAPARRCPA